MASTQLTKTFANNGNRKTMTFSFWVKRGTLGTNQYPFSIYDSSSGLQADIRFITTDIHRMYATDTSTNTSLSFQTNRVFRDTSAWYHIVWAIDTTQATESNRVKLYVNGVQETSFSQAMYPSQNLDLRWNGNNNADTGGVNYIGAINGGNYLDGSMSHINFIDGTAYDASAFGEYDANGVWKINTSPSVTYGANGYFILKDGNSVTDQSGQGNNWTVGGGTLTKTEDSPSNVFATLNPLQSQIGGATLSLGNTKLVTGNGNPLTGTTVATLGVSSGKFYWETKLLSAVSSTMPCFSVVGENCLVQHYLTSASVGDYVTYTPRVVNEIYERYNDGSNSNNYSYGDGSTINVNDIIGCALDKDNGKVYWSINGTWINSGDPVNGTNPASSNVNNLRGDFVFPAFGDEQYNSSAIFETNFGNGYFGTTAVSSAGTNASGIGIFEYDVPTGYTALSTKGLNT